MTDACRNDGLTWSTVSSKETCTHVGYIDGENMTIDTIQMAYMIDM